jgi:hypothetical protein
MNQPEEICVAILPKDDKRGEIWREAFGGMGVPVIEDEPQMTVLPDESNRLCYYVDFNVGGMRLAKMIAAACGRRPGKNSAQIIAMLQKGIYPILAENVTVVRAPITFWGMQPPAVE